MKKQKKLYTLDDLKEVWYMALVHGATFWAYSVEKGHDLPHAFNIGVDEMRKKVVDADTLSFLLSNQAIALGLYAELAPVSSVSLDEGKTSPKESKKSKKSQVK